MQEWVGIRSIKKGDFMKKQMKQSEQLANVHPNAAGLDIGSREIFGSIPPDRNGPTVKRFGTFTPDLYAHDLLGWHQ